MLRLRGIVKCREMVYRFGGQGMASEMYRTYKFTTVGTCLAALVVHEICVPVGGVVPQGGVRL